MKKIMVMVLMICMLLAVPFATSSVLSVDAAESKNTVILLEGAKQNEKEITVDVNVKENSGVFSMYLEIQYDETVMELTKVDRGTALESLTPDWTGDLSVANSEGKLKITGVGTEPINDYSTGKLMTLTFKVKDNAEDGSYSIKLAYEKNKDVTYLQGNKFPTKNIITNGVKITLKGSVVDQVVTEDINGNNSTLKWALIGTGIGIVVIGAVVAAVVVTKKKKGKWVKL